MARDPREHDHDDPPTSTGFTWLQALRVAGPFLLIAGSAWSSPLTTVFTLTLTGDRLLGVAALAALIVVGLRRQAHWTPVHTALAIFVGAQILTTLLNAGTWPQGPKFVAVYVLGFACFALAAECARGADGQRRMASAWIAVAVVVAIVGTVVANLSNVYQRPLWGAGQAQVLFAGTSRRLLLFGPQVTLSEWNLFSSFLVVPFTLSLWLWRRDGGSQRGRVAALAAAVFGLVTGITRATWLSMAALVMLWTWAKRPRPGQLATLGAMAAAALLVQALCLGASPLFERGLERSTVTHRFIINDATIESWETQPLLGHGAGSVNRLSVPTRAGPPMKIWTGNVVLFVLHDSGMLGFATLLALTVVVCRRGWRAMRRDAHAPTPSLVVPLLAAGAALAFAYQFTHALWLMYPYVYLGFLTASTEPEGGDA